MKTDRKFWRILALLLVFSAAPLSIVSCVSENKASSVTLAPSIDNGSEDSVKDQPSDEDSEADTDTQPENKNEFSLRFGSYNIKHGEDAELDMSKLADVIKEAELDVVGLQEVDQRTTRVNGIDTMKQLSAHTGYPYYAFFKAIDYRGGEYGLGILSKYPITETERTPLESADKEQRVLGRAAINVYGNTVNFFVTHLSYESAELRGAQFKQIADILKEHGSFVLTGDFNTSDFSEYAAIEGSQTVNNASYSVPTFTKGTSIDNIVYSSDVWSFAEPKTNSASYSDHYLLFADATFKKGT